MRVMESPGRKLQGSHRPGAQGPGGGADSTLGIPPPHVSRGPFRRRAGPLGPERAFPPSPTPRRVARATRARLRGLPGPHSLKLRRAARSRRPQEEEDEDAALRASKATPIPL